jgi:hypothetical protein
MGLLGGDRGSRMDSRRTLRSALEHSSNASMAIIRVSLSDFNGVNTSQSSCCRIEHELKSSYSSSPASTSDRNEGTLLARSLANVLARLVAVIVDGFEKKNRESSEPSSSHFRVICAAIVDFPVPAWSIIARIGVALASITHRAISSNISTRVPSVHISCWFPRALTASLAPAMMISCKSKESSWRITFLLHVCPHLSHVLV